MTARRVRTLVLSGLAPVIVIALVFGNPWAVEFAAKHDLVEGVISVQGNGAGDSFGRLVAWLQFPSWRLQPRGSLSFLAVHDFSLLLLFAAIALLGLAGARAVDPRRGAVSVLIVGWWATAVAGGVAGLVRGVLVVMVGGFPGSVASNFVWTGIEAGALFGLFYGWLPGVAMLLAFLATRPKEAASPAPHGGASGAQGQTPPPPPPPPPLPQRVPQSPQSPRPPGPSQPPAVQWPPRRQQPSWPAQPHDPTP